MVTFLIDLDAGRDVKYYFASQVSEIIRLLQGHNSDLEFMRVERVQEIPQEPKK